MPYEVTLIDRVAVDAAVVNKCNVAVPTGKKRK
jgi:hypothetical protein